MRNDNLGTQQIYRGVGRAYISVPGSRCEYTRTDV